MAYVYGLVDSLQGTDMVGMAGQETERNVCS